MKMKANAFDYAELITKSLPRGILLNTMGERFNSMVIGWGHLGVIWGLPTFTVYVRQSRFTKPLLDAAGEFGISVPLNGKLDPETYRICGTLSGRDVDKAALAHLTLEPGECIAVPGIREVPLTLECRLLYTQDQDLAAIPEDIREHHYMKGAAAGDFHTAYIGQIVNTYIIG